MTFLYEVKLATIDSREIAANTLAFASKFERVCVQQNARATERLTEHLISKPAYVKNILNSMGFSD